MLNAKREATNSIRRELAKDHPRIARVNAEYSLWKSTDEILQETILRTEGHVGLLKHLSELALGRGVWRLELWSPGPQEELLGELW